MRPRKKLLRSQVNHISRESTARRVIPQRPLVTSPRVQFRRRLRQSRQTLSLRSLSNLNIDLRGKRRQKEPLKKRSSASNQHAAAKKNSSTNPRGLLLRSRLRKQLKRVSR